MKPLNVGLSLLAVVAVMVIATQVPLMHDTKTGAQTSAAASSSTASSKDATPSYYFPSQFVDSERNAPDAGEAAPTF